METTIVEIDGDLIVMIPLEIQQSLGLKPDDVLDVKTEERNGIPIIVCEISCPF